MIRFLLISSFVILSAASAPAQTGKATPAATPTPMKAQSMETASPAANRSFGQMAHVFSTYESPHAPEDAKPFQRGINSIQLMNDGKRWWIVTIFWQGEDEKNPLPEKYLK